MKKTQQLAAIVISLLAWSAIVSQFYLMVKGQPNFGLETVVRFCSYFTILTNSLGGLYFTFETFNGSKTNSQHTGFLTPITVYITIVGVVYQILLRHTWSPEGLQRIVDELLHTIIPVLTLVFWYVYAPVQKANYRRILWWMNYPLVYLIFILLRGSFSNFYPYPFVDVSNLGFTTVMVNSLFILVFFFIISSLFIRIKSKPTY